MLEEKSVLEEAILNKLEKKEEINIEPSLNPVSTVNSSLVSEKQIPKKKPFVFTEKRKESFAKANQARLERQQWSKKLREDYTKASQDLKSVFQQRVQELTVASQNPVSIPISEPPKEIPEMSTKPNTTSQEQEIPVEKVIPDLKKEKKPKIVYASDSDSEESTIVIRKPKKSKKQKSKKKVVYVDPSDSDSSSEEEVPPSRKPPVRATIPVRTSMTPAYIPQMNPMMSSSKYQFTNDCRI